MYVGTGDKFATVEDSKWIQKQVTTVRRTNIVKKINEERMTVIDLKCTNL